MTRWVGALLSAAHSLGDARCTDWAAELVKVGERFVDKSEAGIRMHWKMSVDLTRPAVPSMGTHDPLDGLMSALSAGQAAPEKRAALAPFVRDMAALCERRGWSTTDPLGIGGLMLHVARAAKLASMGVELPGSVSPGALFEDALESLEVYSSRIYYPGCPPAKRLAFRECGLSLGLRVLAGAGTLWPHCVENIGALEGFLFLADELEDSWLAPENQTVPSWTEHLDINTVTLAASLVASRSHEGFI